MFTFQFDVTPEDVFQYHYFVMEEQPNNKMRAVIRRSVIFLCYAILAAFLFVRGHYAFAMAVMVVAVVFFLLTKPLNRLMIRTRVKTLWKKDAAQTDRTVSMQFEEDGIDLRSHSGEFRLKYTDLQGVYANNGYVFLMNRVGNGVYLPHRVFHDEKEYDIFLQFLSLKTEKTIQ